MTPDEEAVRATHVAWIEAVNAGDLECLLGLMTEDVVFLNPGQAPSGRSGFPDGFAGAHRRFALRCTSEPDEIVIIGDHAYTRCTDSLTLTPREDAGNGSAVIELAGHRLTIYRRQPDGRWRLARDAHTLSPVTR